MLWSKRWGALFAGLVVLVLAVTGCQDVGEPEVPAAAVLEAQQFLANELGVEVSEVEIEETEQVDWSDACLGLGGPEEACAQVITPGWRVMFEVNGQEYEVRTDEDASQIRIAET